MAFSFVSYVFQRLNSSPFASFFAPFSEKEISDYLLAHGSTTPDSAAVCRYGLLTLSAEPCSLSPITVYFFAFFFFPWYLKLNSPSRPHPVLSLAPELPNSESIAFHGFRLSKNLGKACKQSMAFPRLCVCNHQADKLCNTVTQRQPFQLQLPLTDVLWCLSYYESTDRGYRTEAIS